MTTFNAYSSIDMFTRLIDVGPVTSTSPTEIIHTSGNLVATYSGEDFKYAGGFITSGTFTGFSIKDDRGLLYDAMGVSLPSESVHAALGSDNFVALLGQALQGDDSISGSPSNDRLLGYAGNDSIIGGGSDDFVSGGDGNDHLLDVSGANQLDGGDGLDTANFLAIRSAHTISVDAFGIHVAADIGTSTPHGQPFDNDLQNIERLAFTDGTLAFDISGNAGQAYRIYRAAFDRQPDLDGLSYWIRSMDDGKPLLDVAAFFIVSPEFNVMYGNTPSNLDFVHRLYENILDREGEADGVSFWLGQLDAGASKSSVLVNFSESAENIEAVAPTIAEGIWFV